MQGFCARDIMTRDVVTVRKGTSVEGALKLMAEHHISGLPVVDTDGSLVGVITQSDLLLKESIAPPQQAEPTGVFAREPVAVDEAYRRSHSQLVEEAMTTKVIAFMEDSLVSDIARAMIERMINRVPIVREGKVVGIISRRDVVKAMAHGPGPAGDYRSDEVGCGRVVEL